MSIGQTANAIYSNASCSALHSLLALTENGLP